MPLIIFLALVMMLKMTFPLGTIFRNLGFPLSHRHGMHGFDMLMSPAFLLQWAYPVLVVGIFMVISRLTNRYRPSFAGPCLAVGVLIGGSSELVYFAASLVQGGGMAYVVAPYAALAMRVAQVFMLVGLVKMFLSLSPVTPSNA